MLDHFKTSTLRKNNLERAQFDSYACIEQEVEIFDLASKSIDRERTLNMAPCCRNRRKRSRAHPVFDKDRLNCERRLEFDISRFFLSRFFRDPITLIERDSICCWTSAAIACDVDLVGHYDNAAVLTLSTIPTRLSPSLVSRPISRISRLCVT